MNLFPKVTRTYLNHHLDSTRWQVYEPRDDDIIVTTSYKSGTTFTQQILYNILVGNTLHEEHFPELGEVAPWIDARFFPVPKEELGEFLKSLQHRRFLKSHLPLDGQPYFENVKYIVVARDPRDVFMSLLNHYSSYTDFAYIELASDDLEPMPRYDGDVKQFWLSWISKGWFEWEQEGYPFWSNMHHTQSYWDYKHLPNFLFLHYVDMRRDLAGTIKRIGNFIDHELSDTEVTQIEKAVSFDRVKEQAIAESAGSNDDEQVFRGGQATFINKGTDGRWRGVLDEADLKMYEVTRDKVLTEDCAAWLEGGDAVLRS